MNETCSVRNIILLPQITLCSRPLSINTYNCTVKVRKLRKCYSITFLDQYYGAKSD